MKLQYEDTQLLVEALEELLIKCKDDIDNVKDRNGAIKLEIPTEQGRRLLRKEILVEHLIEQIKKGTVEF